MPWCETCSKFWNPNSVTADGTCPTCGRALPAPTTLASPEHGAATADAGPEAEGADDYRAPWHFKLLVLAVVLYLGWRAVQGVEWVLQQL